MLLSVALAAMPFLHARLLSIIVRLLSIKQEKNW